jgi:hypothetical protein
MDKVNVQSLGGRLLVKLHCDRLYDVLLAKAYRRHYPREDQAARQQQDEYPVILAVDCDSRGLVTDMWIAPPGDGAAS